MGPLASAILGISLAQETGHQVFAWDRWEHIQCSEQHAHLRPAWETHLPPPLGLLVAEV